MRTAERIPASKAAEPDRQSIPATVNRTLHSSGEPLDSSVRARMEARFQQDFSAVRVHSDTQAAQSAEAVRARAYTVGSHIVFNQRHYAPQTHEGQRLIAHELTHVSQQKGQMPSGSFSMTRPSDSSERNARRITTQAAANQPLSTIQPAPLQLARDEGGYAPTVVIEGLDLEEGESIFGDRDETDAPPETYVVSATGLEIGPLDLTAFDPLPDNLQRIFTALSYYIDHKNEAQADSQGLQAFLLLSVRDQLRVLNRLEYSQLESLSIGVDEFTSSFEQFDSPLIPASDQLDQATRVRTLIDVVLLAFDVTNQNTLTPEEAERFAQLLSLFSASGVKAILNFLVVHGQISEEELDDLLAISETLSAERSGTEDLLDPLATGGATIGSITPLPWNPPGGQWIPYYLGNSAHVGIATVYRFAHDGDEVFTNSISVQSILGAFTGDMNGQANPDALSGRQLRSRPDIANMTRNHLYEIKSWRGRSQGRREAKAYQRAFRAAGVPMSLGPTTEPGTSGMIPAPAGAFVFSAPEAGVITYRYRRIRQPEPVRKPVRRPAPARSRSTSSHRFRVPDWLRLPALAPQQQQAVVATVALGTLAIIAAMILLSPVGI